MNRFGLLAAWVAATGLATVLAWQVVGAADDQISDSPTTPLIALTATDTSTQTSNGEPTDDPTSGSETTPTVPATSTTTGPDGSSTTTSPDTTTTTTSTPPGSSTSTTTSGTPATTTAVSSGGTVTVTGIEPAVELVAVVAVPGWSYQVVTNDGTRVEVVFQSVAGAEVLVRCEWDDGRLQADIDDD